MERKLEQVQNLMDELALQMSPEDALEFYEAVAGAADSSADAMREQLGNT